MQSCKSELISSFHTLTLFFGFVEIDDEDTSALLESLCSPPPGPSQAMGHIHPARREVAQPINFSPQKSVDEILAHNKGEGKAGKAAVHLAQFVFFGADVMRQNTAATLDVAKMREIKNIIII